MIKLIKNEFIKNGKYKLLFSLFFFFIIILIIKEYSDNFKSTMYSLIPFIGVLGCVYFSGIISNEIENGTFRFYLTKPVSRNNIYISKYFSIIIFLLIICLFIFLIYMFYCEFSVDDFILYFKYLCPLLLISSLIMFLSVIFKNTSVVVGISVFLLVFSTLLSQVLFGIGFTYIEYTFLPYMDFSIFNDVESLSLMNSELGINLSISSGLYINIIYSVLLFLLGLFIFAKKDIKN